MNVWDPLLTTIIIIGDTAHAKQGPTLASQVASKNLRTSDLLQPYPPCPEKASSNTPADASSGAWCAERRQMPVAQPFFEAAKKPAKPCDREYCVILPTVTSHMLSASHRPCDDCMPMQEEFLASCFWSQAKIFIMSQLTNKLESAGRKSFKNTPGLLRTITELSGNPRFPSHHLEA